MPIQEQLRKHAAATPEKAAFVIGRTARSFREVYENARAFSASLETISAARSHTHNVPGVRRLVALSLGNHPAFAELFAGATAAPDACAVMDPNMLPDQIEDILLRLRPDLVVVDDAHSTTADIARKLECRIYVAGDAPAMFPPPPDRRPVPAAAADGGTFLIGFTSGTTTRPKAYSRCRRSWRTSLDAGRGVFDLAHGPSTMCPGALAHGLALYALVETLDAGGTFHSVRTWDRDAVGEALARGDIERLVAVPTMITALAKASSAYRPPFGAVRDVLTAGAKLDLNHIDLMRGLFPQARVMEYYGASELGFISVSTPGDGDGKCPIDRVGQAFPGVEITIRDPDENEVDAGVPGTIFVRSDLISAGYLWGDDGQAFRVSAAGATVGDLGEINADGMLKVIGRAGGMIITGGFNVYPAEVERVLKTVPDVDDAVVIGREDPYLGRRLIAVVSGDVSSLNAIAGHCGTHLPRYKIPREIYRIETWPLTSSGKIARQQVEQAVLNGDPGLVPLSA